MNDFIWLTVDLKKAELTRAFQYGHITWKELMEAIDRLQFNLLNGL